MSFRQVLSSNSLWKRRSLLQKFTRDFSVLMEVCAWVRAVFEDGWNILKIIFQRRQVDASVVGLALRKRRRNFQRSGNWSAMCCALQRYRRQKWDDWGSSRLISVLTIARQFQQTNNVPVTGSKPLAVKPTTRQTVNFNQYPYKLFSGSIFMSFLELSPTSDMFLITSRPKHFIYCPSSIKGIIRNLFVCNIPHVSLHQASYSTHTAAFSPGRQAAGTCNWLLTSF